MLQFRDFKEGDESQLIPLITELKKFYPNIDKWVQKEISELPRVSLCAQPARVLARPRTKRRRKDSSTRFVP